MNPILPQKKKKNFKRCFSIDFILFKQLDFFYKLWIFYRWLITAKWTQSFDPWDSFNGKIKFERIQLDNSNHYFLWVFFVRLHLSIYLILIRDQSLQDKGSRLFFSWRSSIVNLDDDVDFLIFDNFEGLLDSSSAAITDSICGRICGRFTRHGVRIRLVGLQSITFRNKRWFENFYVSKWFDLKNLTKNLFVELHSSKLLQELVFLHEILIQQRFNIQIRLLHRVLRLSS